MLELRAVAKAAARFLWGDKWWGDKRMPVPGMRNAPASTVGGGRSRSAMGHPDWLDVSTRYLAWP